MTRTVRGIDAEIELGPEDGMPVACAVSLDKALLTDSITRLDAKHMDAVCRALARAARC